MRKHTSSITMSRTYKFANPEGIYFLSFATVGWIDVFTRRIYKDILIDSLDFCIKNKGLSLFCYVIMSNHLHLIAKAQDGFELSGIIRDFKKFTSKRIIKTIEENPVESRSKWMLSIFKKAGEYNSNNKFYQFWQQDNHPIELYTKEVIDQKIEYIHNNPVKEGYVSNPEDYLYSSARNYTGLDHLIEIELI